ncbi:glycosyltransferase [Pelobium sp.]|nr:glycosyltransferase [Pelobium sp.]MDA9555677.1 glycosyltransferase [Pelobium sp.]
MKIGYISTSIPRSCGLATFNENLKLAIEKNYEVNADGSFVIALNDSDQLDQYAYSTEVKYIIRQQNQKDYARAAQFINSSKIDACIIQHEFGIYGGDCGTYILPLIYSIQKPLVAILHTVLKEPNYLQKLIIKEIARQSAKVVVMAQKAVDFLENIYGIAKEKIVLIEHGVPDFEIKSINPIKEIEVFRDRKMLLTFGLISKNKGLETMIKALPNVVKLHPEVIYTIIGNTHPHVKKSQGEEYRESLKLLVKKLGLMKNVLFINNFLTEEELFDYLSATEIYITPYLNEAQITSGTLSYAIGAGAAIVSTPYWHAQELLAENRGKLFDFGNHEQLSNIINELLNDENELQTIKKNALEYGQHLKYSTIGKSYTDLLVTIISERQSKSITDEFAIDMEILPNFTLEHIKRLTDDTGIIQHARFGIPNLKEGYCMDDNARALIMAIMAYDQFKNEDALRLLPIYLSFIQYMQFENGDFRNFLSFKREYLDENGTDDSFGRTLWALGFMVNNAPNNSYKEFAKDLFLNSIPHIEKLSHLRGFANSAIGLCYYLKTYPDENLGQQLIQLSDELVEAYQKNKSEKWYWFEEKMTYDNAIIPMALLKAYEITERYIYKEIGLEALSFLDQETLNEGYYNPIGNDGWYFKGKEKSLYDQQAIETMAAVMLYFQAYTTTLNTDYIKKMFQTYLWFLGENSLRIPLYDHETNGCGDGLTPVGLNRNQGAESTLAFSISHLTVLKAFEKEYLFSNKEEAKVYQK